MKGHIEIVPAQPGIWNIKNKKGVYLGFIRWDHIWKCHVYEALDRTHYDKSCMKMITEKLENLDLQKEEQKKGENNGRSRC